MAAVQIQLDLVHVGRPCDFLSNLLQVFFYYSSTFLRTIYITSSKTSDAFLFKTRLSQWKCSVSYKSHLFRDYFMCRSPFSDVTSRI